MNDTGPFYVFGLMLVILLGVGVYAFVNDDTRERCEAAGGRILSKTTSAIGVTGGGNIAISPVTVSFCVSADGRILD